MSLDDILQAVGRLQDQNSLIKVREAAAAQIHRLRHDGATRLGTPVEEVTGRSNDDVIKGRKK
jgi:hypothetical protein